MIVEPGPDHVVWVDGEFLPWRDATMHVSAHHYGFGVFEGVRAYGVERGAAIFRLEDHTTRLLRSAHILRIRIPDAFGRPILNDVQQELLRRNRLRDAYLRPFVFYGGTSGLSRDVRDLPVHVAVLVLDWREDGAYRSREAKARGLALRTATFTRHHPNGVLSKAKANGNYMNAMLALQEAQGAGADDALLLDQNGFVTESTGANIFVIRDGAIYTPPLTAVLEGITRDTVITLAAEMGLSVKERVMTRDDIYVADEVFLTGTAVEIMPIREVDGRKIGSGERGPLTERLQARYSDLVRGCGEDRREWLTRIRD